MLSIDSNLFENVAYDIQQFTHEQIAKHRSIQGLGVSLQKQFNLINEISIRHKIPQLAYIHIIASKPLLAINNQWMLTDNGCITESNYYRAKPEISIKVPATSDLFGLAEHFLTMLKNYHPSIWSHYTINWYDPTCIYLYDRENAHFCVIAHAHMQFDQELLKKVSILQSLICKKTTKAQTRWIADVRFKNQIIVSSENVKFKDRNESQNEFSEAPNEALSRIGKKGEVL